MSLDELDFYREARTCRKCGGSATTHFVDDLIVRKCLRCGYKWREKPLDYDEEQTSDQGKESGVLE